MPERGWLPIEVSSNDGNCCVDVSDVPLDSILNLVMALMLLARGLKHEEVLWSNEPEYRMWTFDVDGDFLHDALFWSAGASTAMTVLACCDGHHGCGCMAG